MNLKDIKKILNDTDYVRTGGTKEELQAAEYLKAECEKRGASARLETFPVQMAEMKKAVFKADGKEVPCKGYLNSGSAKIEGEFLYLPDTDEASLLKVKDKIVMLDSGIGHFLYKDLLKAGVKGIVTYDGNVNFRDNDIDQKELRAVVHEGVKTPAVNINAKDALKLVKDGVKTASIELKQKEYEGESRNVVAEIPGATDEWIVLTAHYDST